MASVSSDKTVRVWNMSGSEIARFQSNDGLLCVRFCSDERFLIFGSMGNTVCILNWRDGLLVAVLQGHTDACWGLDVFPKSDQIISCSLDRTAIIWSRSKPQEDLLGKKDFDYSVDMILEGHKVYL